MKGTEFINLMRKVIREEVRSVVKEELKAFKPVIVESKQQSVTKIEAPKRPVVKQQQVQKTVQTPKFEGPLASILEETYRAMQANPTPEEDEWPDMNGGVVTMNNMPGGMGASMASMMDNSFDAVLQDQNPGLPPMMRDYSTLLKKADDIANNKR